MARNTGKGYRKGSVTDRTQLEGSNGNYIERDRTTGKFTRVKTTNKEPFKGVAKEEDHRRD